MGCGLLDVGSRSPVMQAAHKNDCMLRKSNKNTPLKFVNDAKSVKNAVANIATGSKTVIRSILMMMYQDVNSVCHQFIKKCFSLLTTQQVMDTKKFELPDFCFVVVSLFEVFLHKFCLFFLPDEFQDLLR